MINKYCINILFYLFLQQLGLIIAISNEDLHEIFGQNDCIDANLFPIPIGKLDKFQPDYEIIEGHSSFQQDLNTDANNNQKEDNYLLLIHNLAQYNKIKVDYELVNEKGPGHNKFFLLQLVLGDEIYKGEGTSVKKAQKNAAKLALKETNYEHPWLSTKLKESENILTPTVILNNIGMKLGIPISYKLINSNDIIHNKFQSNDVKNGKSYFKKLNESIYKNFTIIFSDNLNDDIIKGPFIVELNFGDHIFFAIGHTIQSAKHNAASQAIDSINKNHIVDLHDCTTDNDNVYCKEKRDNLKSPISQINEIAQKRKIPLEFNLISETGLGHKKLFVIQCKLGNLVSEAEGKSKKEAKILAAKNLLGRLWELPDNSYEGIKDFNVKKKKKKKIIIKNSFDGLRKSFNDLFNSFWGDNGKSENNQDNGMKTQQNNKKTSCKFSPKNELLKVCNYLKIQTEFIVLNHKNDNHYALLSLGINPSQICLGIGYTKEKAFNQAALIGLKLLHKMKLLEYTQWFKQIEDTSIFDGQLSVLLNEWQIVDKESYQEK